MATPGVILPNNERFEAARSKKELDDPTLSDCTRLNIEANALAQEGMNNKVGGVMGIGSVMPANVLSSLSEKLAARRELGCSAPTVKADAKNGMSM